MIVIRRVFHTKNVANFGRKKKKATKKGYANVPKKGYANVPPKTWVGKSLPDANSQSTSYYSPNSRGAKKLEEAYNRDFRRNAKLEARASYYDPTPSYSPDPIYEQKIRQYQVEQNLKNQPKPSDVWEAAQDDMGKARERMNDAFNQIKDDVGSLEPKRSLNPKLLLAGLGATAIVGAGAYFIRRRKSKKGKMIVERVRR